MENNVELSLYKNGHNNFAYPSLGSNYLPNLIVDERIARFLRNTVVNINVKNNIETELYKYKYAISQYLNGKTIIEKSGLLNYSSQEGEFVIYIDDLLSATNITLTLLCVVNLTEVNGGKTVPYPTQPESFNYDKKTGIFHISDTGNYNLYECYYMLTGDVYNDISLSYSLIYNSDKSTSA
jgi:hypothetical protein